MRYFRYRNAEKNYERALKEQYRRADTGDRRLIRRHRAWKRLGKAVFMLIFVCLVIAETLLFQRIPLPEALFFRVLIIAGLIALGLLAVALSAYFSYILTIPVWNQAEKYSLPAIKKEILSKAPAHLRDYYGLNEPYMVTKCFDASDGKWKNHDVCIFVEDDELRITADLVKGFLHGESDLGCCAFKRSEITLLKRADGNKLKLELRSKDDFFVLGYRAKGFIERNFLGK